MQVFNACIKVIRKNLPSMLIYLFIFIFFVLLLTVFYRAPADDLFEPVRPRIAIFNEDADDPYTTAFVAWLEGKTLRITLADDRQAIQDAIFYRYVHYVLRIPAGFGEQVMAHDMAQLVLQRTQSPDNWAGTTTDLLVERYIRLSILFASQLDDLSPAELTAAVQSALDSEAGLQMQSGEKREINRTAYYFIYLAYSMMAVMILGITSVLLVFSQPDLRRRNLSSPLNLVRFNAQLIAGCLLFALASWLVMVLISLAMGGYELPYREFLLLALNALTFTLACLSLSFLLSQFIRTRAVQQSMANVLALGTCFISGVFVPQELLGDAVQTAASFTPTYWYVLAVNKIDSLTQFTFQDVRPVLQHMLIQLGFAAALLAVAMAVIRQKRQTQS